jgi:hypothetical protein
MRGSSSEGALLAGKEGNVHGLDIRDLLGMRPGASFIAGDPLCYSSTRSIPL